MRRLSPLLLVAACATPPATVDRQPGIDGSWSQGQAQLDVTGAVATLAFHGRILVFDAKERLRGQIHEDEVDLMTGRLRVHVDEKHLEINDGKASVKRSLAEIPAGTRFAWKDGELKAR
jgi:hypothetical protein